MSGEPGGDTSSKVTKARRAEAVRLIVTRRERAPRSPKMERAFKRLIWRYLSPAGSDADGGDTTPLPASEPGSGDEREGGC